MALTLSDFLGRFAEVREERDGYAVPCPAHADSRPSLRVALSDKGNLVLRCRRGCATKDVVAALGLRFADLFNVQPGDGVKTTASRTEAVGPRDIAALAMYLGEAADRLRDPDDPHAAAALAYAADRFGIDPPTASALGLGVDPGGTVSAFAHLGTPYRRVPRLVVPFRDFEGVGRGLQGRDLTGTDSVRWCGPTNPEGASWAKLGVLNLGTDHDVWLVTEGPGDGLAAAAAGYNAVVVRGAALAGNPELVAALAAGLRGKRVIAAGDRDAAGESFNRALAAALAEHGLPVAALVVPPEPADGDLSGWRKHDPAGFRAALDRAVRQAPPVTQAPPPAAPATADGDDYPMTDLGNAGRLFRHLEGLVRFAAETGFYLWDGTVWVLDRFDAVRTAAHEVTRGMVREGQERYDAAPDKDGAEAKAAKGLIGWGLRSQSTRSIDSMIKELSVMPGVQVDVERLDGRHDLLALRNGTIDLRTGTLRPHDPDDLMTRKVNVDYDPDALAPTWDYFLTSVFPDHPDLPAFVQRLVGYGITGHTREQSFAVLWGKGSNGKSVFTDTLTKVFRAITVTTPFSTFEAKPNGGIPNDLAALKGARLVMASEGDQGRAMAEAVIKRVTGMDLISARFMRKEFFEFSPTFLIFLATNYKPNFKGQDEGLWRRVKLIPWARYFAPHERDHYLTEKLLAEAPGIVAWAVRGAVEWYANGLQEPAAVREATKSYRETADNLQGFLPGRLVRDPAGSMLGADAYLAYREWAEEEGFSTRDVWTRRTLYGALEERGIDRVKKERGITLLGVRKAEPGETPEATEAHAARTAEAPTAKVPQDPAAPDLDDALEADHDA